jgi:hypothetical protein
MLVHANCCVHTTVIVITYLHSANGCDYVEIVWGIVSSERWRQHIPGLSDVYAIFQLDLRTRFVMSLIIIARVRSLICP